MTIRFDDQVAIVTGAGAGLGRDYALALAKRGAKVVVNDLATIEQADGSRISAAQSVADEIIAMGGEAIANSDSVANPETAASIVEAAIAKWGRVDVLVNNAGILRDSSFAKAQVSDIQDVINVHLLGTLYLTHACWPHMIAQGYGRIIVATSMVGYTGNFGQTAYGSAKLGVVGMMKTLAIEGIRKGVLINAISPAAVTQMSKGLNPPALEKYMTSEKVVPALVYLASKANEQTGMIIEAMAGGLGRVEFFENDLVGYGPASSLTPEMVADKWTDAIGMTGATEVRHGPADRPIDYIKAHALWEESAS